MNRSIRAVSIVVGLMFLALMANITITYFVRTDDLLGDSRNVRVRDERFGHQRGPILASNSAIADSVAADSQTYPYQRAYLDGPLYAPITGYYSYIYGSSGLESTYDAELTGQADSQFVTRLVDYFTGRQARGGQIQTTISPDLQQASWDALAGREGAVVALDYTTGAILAWVSYPSYDPSSLASLDFTATQEAWEQLNGDQTRPMNDRATKEIYPPGSTFKMVVASAALENGYTADTMVDTPASLVLPDTTTSLPNESNCGNTQQSLDNAFTLSCNTTFANIGMALGADTVRKYAEAFGFDAPVVSDVNSATSRFPETLDQAQLAMSSIGQFEVAASPLQMAMVAGTIANGGVRFEPYVVSEIRDANQKVVSTHTPNNLGQAIQTTTASTMQQLMQHVVENGTGTQARVEGRTIGGKTGTAETTADAESYSWFAGFDTGSHIALAVFLAEPQGQTAAAAAGQIFRTLQ